MKRLRVWALAASLAACAASGWAFAQDAKPAQIDRNGVLILIRSSLLALDQANKTGNYTVLRDLGAPGFQASNTAARLGEIFVNLRRDKIDLSGVAVLDPQLTLLPQIEGNGMMRMAGFLAGPCGAAAAGAVRGAAAGAVGPLWPSPTDMPKGFHCPSTGA